MDGKVHTYKARLVAKGYTQTYRINYEETFSPVAKIKSIRIILAIAAFHDYEIWQMDVKTNFLNGKLTKDVFMAQPKGSIMYAMTCTRSDVSFALSMNEGGVTWKSSKQDTAADSTCESEYIAVCKASKEAIWMKNLVGDLGVVSTIQDPIEIFYDNENAFTLIKEPKDHGKSKHIKKIPFCSKQSRRRTRDCQAHTIRG
ncbi:retrovirus-related pol polyprotein from transposon TNT 1-94 [Tanacetum coccineum]